MRVCPIIVLCLVLVGALVLALYLPIAAVNDIFPPCRDSFPPCLALYQTERLACECKADWPLASNEKTLSDTYGAQTVPVLEPRGLNNLAWAWGQFIAHDIVRTRASGTGPVFAVGGMNLTRIDAQVFEATGCRWPRTDLTPLIDASTVYGDGCNVTAAQLLRDDNGKACKLRVGPGNLLPQLPGQPTDFLAGDSRSAENSVLTSLHVVFLREHNRLCDVIGSRKPWWSEDEKYWKARDVVIAKIQHITYTEWLPAILGAHLGSELAEKAPGATLTVEFATAAFRFGHSMVPDQIGPFSLTDMFFNPTLIQTYGIEAILAPALQERALRVDLQFSNSLRLALFGSLDLLAVNLFRGRDVTLGSFETLYECYHGIAIHNYTFSDPLLGLLSEPLAPGSSLPPTMAAIVSEQFARLRKYDPDFYTTLLEKRLLGPYFKREILEETTLANLLLQNTNLNFVQVKGFFSS